MARKTSLTDAQLRRLRKIAQARRKTPTNKTLANEMKVSERTIESYISKFMWTSTRSKKDDAMSDDKRHAGGITLDSKRFRQLVQLCHPDKHNGSLTATEITQWLMANRP